MNVDELEARLDEIRSEAIQAIAAADRIEDAIQIKNRYVGRSGKLQDVMKLLRDLPPDGKRAIGQASNAAKGSIEEAYEARVAAIESRELVARLERERVDVTLPLAWATPKSLSLNCAPSDPPVTRMFPGFRSR